MHALQRAFSSACFIGTMAVAPSMAVALTPTNLDMPPFVSPANVQWLPLDRSGTLEPRGVQRNAIQPILPGIVTGPGIPSVSPFAIQILKPDRQSGSSVPSVPPGSVRLMTLESLKDPRMPNVPPGSIQTIPPQGQ